MSFATTAPREGPRSPSVYYLDPRLTDCDKTVYRLLLSLRRGRDSVCHATATLAQKLGKSVSTVTTALRRLIRAGYLKRIWTNALRSRRRLVLTQFAADTLPGFEEGPAAPPEAPKELGADRRIPRSDNAESCDLTSQDSAICPVPPLDPPIRSLETEREKGIDDDLERGSRESSSSGFSLPQLQTPEPDPELDPEVLAEASALFGKRPEVESRVRHALGRWSPSWLRSALGAAKKLSATEPVGWGYVLGCLRNFEAEGGPAVMSGPVASVSDWDVEEMGRLFFGQASPRTGEGGEV